jgi:hypothetical protein
MKAKLKDIILPSEFSGNAQFFLYNRYGDPRENGWDKKWITNWHIQKDFPWFPEYEICIHKHFKPLLKQVLPALEKAGVYTEIKSCDGSYELRNIRGSEGVLSVHSWGAAIDMNAAQNPLGSNGTWSEKFIKTMLSGGIFCGREWEPRKDPMHFSMVNG